MNSVGFVVAILLVLSPVLASNTLGQDVADLGPALSEIDRLLLSVCGVSIVERSEADKAINKHKSALVEQMTREKEVLSTVAREYEAALTNGKSPLGINFRSHRELSILPCLEDLLMESRPEAAVEALRHAVLDSQTDKLQRTKALTRVAGLRWAECTPRAREKLVFESLRIKDLQTTAAWIIARDPGLLKAAIDEDRELLRRVALGTRTSGFLEASSPRLLFTAGAVSKDEYGGWLRGQVESEKTPILARIECLDELDKLDYLAKEDRSALVKQISSESDRFASTLKRFVEDEKRPLETRKRQFRLLQRMGVLSSAELQRLARLVGTAKEGK